LCRFYDPQDSLGIGLTILLPLAAMVVALLISFVPLRLWPIIALLVYAASIATFARIGGSGLGAIEWSGESASLDLLWTAPIIAFGFLLCPYLDLTFHRAVQESGARGTFAVGALAFAVMIVLTAAYRHLAEADDLRFVMAHMVVQSLFTMAAHTREMRGARGGANPGAAGLRGGPVTIAAMFALPLLAAFIVPVITAFENAPEIALDTYLRFLVFYGLAFPAYVLFMMTRAYAKPTLHGVQLLLLLVIVLVPLCEAGFIHGHAWLLLFPVLVLLVVRAMRAA
jgi:hypothetical protein